MARKRGVTFDDVVDAAAAIADARGVLAVSPSAVAAAVGVRPPSLYAHVAGAEGLRRALADRSTTMLTAALQRASDTATAPLGQLEAMCHAYRHFARTHPGLHEALLPAPDPAEEPERAAEAMATVLVIAEPLTALGIDADTHVDLIRMLRALLHGFLDLELRGGFGLADPVERSFDTAIGLALAAIVDR